MNKYTNVILLVLYLYEAVICIVQKKGANAKMAKLYTKESLEKYSLIAGIGFLLGAVLAFIGLLDGAGIIKLGIDYSSLRNTLLYYGAYLVLILVPVGFAHFFVLKKLPNAPGQTAEGGKKARKKKEEEEDF